MHGREESVLIKSLRTTDLFVWVKEVRLKMIGNVILNTATKNECVNWNIV